MESGLSPVLAPADCATIALSASVSYGGSSDDSSLFCSVCLQRGGFEAGKVTHKKNQYPCWNKRYNRKVVSGGAVEAAVTYHRVLLLLGCIVRDGSSAERVWIQNVLVGSYGLCWQLSILHIPQHLLSQLSPSCNRWMAGGSLDWGVTSRVKLLPGGKSDRCLCRPISPCPRQVESRLILQTCRTKTRRFEGGVVFQTALSLVRDAVQGTERESALTGQRTWGPCRDVVGPDSRTVKL